MTDRTAADDAGAGWPEDFPPVLYVPTLEEVADPQQARPALRTTRAGKVALLGYTALDRLHAGCGPDQPWVLMSVPMLDELLRVQPYDQILLDLEIPAEHRYVPPADRPDARMAGSAW